MAETLLNPSWYRLAPLRPRLREYAELHRQQFRGQVWYVLQDRQSGRFHRVSPAANLVVSLMDGRRTLDEIWNIAGARFEDDPPTQSEMMRLLAQLHANDLLRGDVPPDFAELADRAQTHRRREMMGRLKNPLALRFALFDPDRLLDRLIPIFRPVFTPVGFCLWLTLVATGIVLAALNWGELTGNPVDSVISAGNVLMLLLTYPVMKLLHEAGHGLATKAFGGEVHEMGVMLLVFMPAPYVDASAATAFPNKWQRIAVSGAGIMVEFGLAAVAMIFWTMAEPGFARALAFNVALIGSVSTLFFNGNPLLRFDAFYILMDLVEIPNLGTRANRYVFYLAQKYLLGMEGAANPVTAPGEGRWLFGYGILSWVYRTALALTIALLVATQFFFVGVLLAVLVVFGVFVTPLVKGAHFLLTSPRLAENRPRVLAVTGGGAGLLALLLFVLPLPYSTVAEGVVWPTAGSDIRAASPGSIDAILVPPGTEIAAGTPVIRLINPGLEAEIELLQAQRNGLAAQFDAVRFSDRLRAGILSEQIRNTDGALALARERRDGLLVRAAARGRFVLPNARDLTGRYVRKGDLIGYVVGDAVLPVRIVVPQARVDLVRGRTGGVELRYATDPTRTVPGHVAAEVPAAQTELPSAALAQQGGGGIYAAQSGDGALRAIEGLFVFDVLPEGSAQPAGYGERPQYLGGRVHVSFDHGYEPVAGRVIRGLRQVFLSYFNV